VPQVSGDALANRQIVVNTLDPGFSIHPELFDRDTMLAVISALDRSELVRRRAGVRHVLTIPEVRFLANQPALLDLAQRYVGPNAIPFRATLFDKSATANWLVSWHQDTALPIRARGEAAEWGPWSMKGGVLHAIAPASALNQLVALRVHLDDSTRGNGPLRVLPATHMGGVLDHEQIDALVDTVEAVDCVAVAGSVLAMRPLLVHASSKAQNGQARRVLHIEFSPTTSFGAGIDLAVG
jgi:ectoine hydroxylase-related dioxygenase (phytanoyl-CoA dioxygenase family)